MEILIYGYYLLAIIALMLAGRVISDYRSGKVPLGGASAFAMGFIFAAILFTAMGIGFSKMSDDQASHDNHTIVP